MLGVRRKVELTTKPNCGTLTVGALRCVEIKREQLKVLDGNVKGREGGSE